MKVDLSMRIFSAKEQEEISQKWCVWQHPVSGQVCCGSRNFIKPLKSGDSLFKEKEKTFSESLYAGGKSYFSVSGKASGCVC